MTHSPKRLPDYEEIPEIEWTRRVAVAGWCILVGFVIAVALVTSFIIAFVPAPGDKF